MSDADHLGCDQPIASLLVLVESVQSRLATPAQHCEDAACLGAAI